MLNRITAAEVCDATTANSSTAVGQQKITTIYKLATHLHKLTTSIKTNQWKKGGHC